MSKFDEIVSMVKDSEPPMELDMTLTCQVCNKSVDLGLYYMADKIVIWTCEDGHRSYMENFGLFG